MDLANTYFPSLTRGEQCYPSLQRWGSGAMHKGNGFAGSPALCYEAVMAISPSSISLQPRVSTLWSNHPIIWFSQRKTSCMHPY